MVNLGFLIKWNSKSKKHPSQLHFALAWKEFWPLWATACLIPAPSTNGSQGWLVKRYKLWKTNIWPKTNPQIAEKEFENKRKRENRPRHAFSVSFSLFPLFQSPICCVCVCFCARKRKKNGITAGSKSIFLFLLFYVWKENRFIILTAADVDVDGFRRQRRRRHRKTSTSSAVSN